jgi:hypothetical protein
MSKEKLFSIIIIAFGFASHCIAQTGIKIQPGTTLKLSSGVAVNIRDMDLINDGELNAASGDGRIIFSGTGNNRIAGTSITGIDELEIAKAINSSLLLEQELQIRSGIWFSTGLLNLNNHNITLFGNAALQNESANSRIIGATGGYVQVSMQLNNPQAINPGNLGAAITSAQNMGLTTIRRGHAMQNLGNGKQSILRYYDILPTNNSSLNATLRVNYLDAELNNQSEADLSLWKTEDNINWIAQGFTSRNTASNYVEKQNINSFSSWTLSSDLTSLPVTDLALWGIWKNEKTALTWTTQSEFNNNRFEIERKYSNENNFTKIGSVKSMHAGGTSSSVAAYSYTDAASASRGTISYRLKQVDNDGQFTYSKIIQLKPELQQLFIQNLYPTRLAGQSIYIHTGGLNLQEMQITLFDNQGRVFMKTKTGYTSQWINLPQLAAGMYQLRIEAGEWIYNGRFVKE